jgi:hypothetical protein
MSWVQRLFKQFMGRQSFAAAEAESKTWMMHCPCGHVQSVWDAGGIRYKAAGRPKKYAKCPACGQSTWQLVERSGSTL